MAGKVNRKKDTEARKATKAIKVLKSAEGDNLSGILKTIKIADKRREWLSSIDRSALKGFTTDEIQQVVYKSGAIDEKDFGNVKNEIQGLYQEIENVEATNKKIIYLILLAIYEQARILLPEQYVKTKIKFAKWIIDEFNVPSSTAYKDARFVETLHEYPTALKYLTDNSIKNFNRKLREIAFKDESLKEELIERLPELTLKEIAEAGGSRNRASWMPTKLPRGRIMHKKKSFEFQSNDPELLEDLILINSNLSRSEIKKLAEQFKKK